MNVNHLTYESKTFLNLLKNIDEDTAVHYWDQDHERIWKGIRKEESIIIKCLDDAKQIMEILSIYFPVLDKYPIPNQEQVKG